MSERDQTLNPYLHGSLGRVFARTAAPIVLFMTVSGLYTVVDALLLGRLAGPKALTAVTLMFPVMMLIVALQSMVSSGMASIVAREIGAGDIRAAEGTVNAANLLAAVVCGLLIVALIFAAPAAVAGYALVHGVTKEAVPSDIWRQIFCVVGGGFAGMSALARLASGVGQPAR